MAVVCAATRPQAKESAGHAKNPSQARSPAAEIRDRACRIAALVRQDSCVSPG
jgi:hypothetical protein